MSILPDRDPGIDEPYPAGLMGPERLGIACHATHTAINNKAGDRDCDGLRGPTARPGPSWTVVAMVHDGRRHSHG